MFLEIECHKKMFLEIESLSQSNYYWNFSLPNIR